jgi:5-methylcytosine-specific restriction enzyme A
MLRLCSKVGFAWEIVAEGYDPTIGFLHKFQVDRLALVFDFMERPTVDRRALEFVESPTFHLADFTLRSDRVELQSMRSTPHRNPRRWYGRRRWRNRARHQLLIEPLCRFCKERGLVVPATIADHCVPHRGDWNAFWLGELQSLCGPCHNRAKRYEENRGFRPDIGLDGYPLDPRHPANQLRRSATTD